MEEEAACRAELAELEEEDRPTGNALPSPKPDGTAPLVAVAQDEVPDPVMQRYMQLVVERREAAAPTKLRPEVRGGREPKVDEFGLPLSADEHCR